MFVKQIFGIEVQSRTITMHCTADFFSSTAGALLMDHAGAKSERRPAGHYRITLPWPTKLHPEIVAVPVMWDERESTLGAVIRDRDACRRELVGLNDEGDGLLTDDDRPVVRE